MKANIKFGTDGWRGLIARDFTFDNVALVASAVFEVLTKQFPKQSIVYVGYDRRFLSKEFAQVVACISAKNGFETRFCDHYVPTPMLSWKIKNTPNCAGGVMITASHNSYEWNGFKFKESFGGSASKETTDGFERSLQEISRQTPDFSQIKSFDRWKEEGWIRSFSPVEEYFSSVLSKIDGDKIAEKKFRVGVDAMRGAGSSFLKKLLEKVGVEVIEIHSEADPTFGGIAPEPIEKNLSELADLVRNRRLICGLATDGDADRLGALDEHGNFFSTQKILSAVYWHMLYSHNRKWNIAKSVSTTSLVDLIAASKGLQSLETAVGFKNIAQEMIRGKAQIGGEESGGIGFTDHVIERDGLFTGLLLLEIMAETGKGLHDIYSSICHSFRPYEFLRRDLHVSEDAMKQAMKRLETQAPREWNSKKVDRIQTIDGYKFYLSDGSWILIRPSGTEPIFRLYAESDTLDSCRALLRSVEDFVLG